MTASLYLHVPFCAGSCDYCDFYSVAAARDDDRFDRFVDILLEDAAQAMQAQGIDRVPSAYVGGGTPSLLGARRSARLFSAIRSSVAGKIDEFTVEANPESADEDFLRVCSDCGVDRLSLGLQSLHEPSRRAVGRIGTAARAREAVESARRLFRGGLSVDFIAGLPLQDAASLLGDIDFALACGVDHVSLYSLTVEPGTRLHERVRAGGAALPSPDQADELWLSGRDRLEAAGLLQYEVSNFARIGAESLHNSRYWRMESYLGCGPGAVGTLVDEAAATALRFAWPADLAAWLRAGSDRLPALETIDRRTFLAECLMMGFRTRDGVDDALFRRRFGRRVEDFVPRSLARRRKEGLARADRPALTAEGLLTLNAFLVDCLSELDETYPRYEESRR